MTTTVLLGANHGLRKGMVVDLVVAGIQKRMRVENTFSTGEVDLVDDVMTRAGVQSRNAIDAETLAVVKQATLGPEQLEGPRVKQPLTPTERFSCDLKSYVVESIERDYGYKSEIVTFVPGESMAVSRAARDEYARISKEARDRAGGMPRREIFTREAWPETQPSAPSEVCVLPDMTPPHIAKKRSKKVKILVDNGYWDP